MKVIEVNDLRKEFVVKKPLIKDNGKKSLFKKIETIKKAVAGI